MNRIEHAFPDYKWIDIEAPTPADLIKLAEEFKIPLSPMSNCLDPEHLPHSLIYDNVTYFILRHFDTKSKPKALTMQELTTKIAFFVGPGYVLTIHRSSVTCVERLKGKINEKWSRSELLKSLIQDTLTSFDHPLDELDAKTDLIEERVFTLKRRNILRPGYVLKRKVSSYRKIFKFTMDVLNKIQVPLEISNRDFVEIRESLEKLIFYVEDNQEEITGLLSLHLSLMSQKTNEASYRTNEIMRVLTVVSIFFLPLNFITGMYGMNFENMPELHDPHGYYIIIAIMAMVAIFISAWIYKKGWVVKEDL
jgi:magnesium transporter